MWFVVVAGILSGQLVELEIMPAPNRQNCHGLAEHTRPDLPKKLLVFCVGPDGDI